MASSHARLRRLVAWLLVLALAFFLINFLSRVAVSANRIFGTHAGRAMTQAQVLRAHRDGTGPRRNRPVPRILHQIFHNWHDPGNETLPADWQIVRQTCLALHPTWEHKARWTHPFFMSLWTEASSRRFIEAEYPFFLDMYDAFKYPVQRVDTLRYFLMRHFGGIYMDLDNGCRTSLEPLLYYPAWTTDGGHGTLSNNILGAEPEHPFWILMTDSLLPWARDFFLPYITVSYATGQWYETELWQIYHARKPVGEPNLLRVMMDMRPTGAPWPVGEPNLLRVMMDMRPTGAPWVFFTAGRGGTWDQWDNRLFGWMGSHLLQVMLYVFVGLGLVTGAAYMRRGHRRRLVF
ncbi:hypothetical protein L249_3028 [Ophiocordyceps polyrhachis-furcata BCC 54312]|uniref:Glycosyltransferase family 32 protein n=1 Tax=Ophiocordyceps polyrhachis-furcata BCC 54312 TaxID=1330021 RepID=A0A367LNG6_9HYPO|nr:hypothetical protein L249_3028 [Ophiocordyceps polyrhachis-furcata BCC 54312]